MGAARGPNRLAYAGLVKSEALMRSSGEVPELGAVSRARQELERGFASQVAAELRSDPQPAIEEALALRQ